MGDNNALVDSIDREKIERARRMSPTEKFLAGPELFEHVCDWMRAGIRDRFPDIDDARVEEILAERLAVSRRVAARK